MTLQSFDAVISSIGSLILLIRIIPQIIKCVKQGHGKGISKLFLVAWLVGEGMILTHFMISNDNLGLIMNYSFMIVCILIVMFYRFFPRK